MWGAIAAIGGSILSGALGYAGASKAADATADAADTGARAALEMFYKGREDLAPYAEVGKTALNKLLGTPATYAATAEDLNKLVQQKSDLESQINELETKGEAFTKTIRAPNYSVEDYESGKPKNITKTIYRQPDPGKVANLKDQLSEINNQITATQEKMGEVETPATPGLLEQYPELAPYPEMPAYPESTPPPAAGAYPTMPAQPIFDFGEGAPVENALLSFGQDAYQESPAYQWQIDQAQKAVERMAAARGYRLSPRAAEEFMTQAEGLAGQDYYKWLGSQLSKADLALTAWKEGRTAAIQDWQLPYQQSVNEWNLARTTGLEDWANQRNTMLQDWQAETTAKSADWTNQYNAMLKLLGVGESAAAGQAANAQDVGNQLANLNLISGNAQSDKYIQQANALSQALASGINNALLLSTMGNTDIKPTPQPSNNSWLSENMSAIYNP